VIYGMTESPFITAAPNITADEAHPDRLASCGVPYGDVRVEVRGPDGIALPAGEDGEIFVTGSLLMDGYYDQPEMTAEALVDGWLRTGDIGHLDEDGYLYLVDRAKDMIITSVGASNVYCRPVEDVLVSHPQVRAAAVVGKPDPLYGEWPHAFVVLTPDATVTAEELIAYALADLNPIWMPRSIDFVDELPLTGGGKVDKKQLRARLAG
jgi:fatty-acyl-CoA synthase